MSAETAAVRPLIHHLLHTDPRLGAQALGNLPAQVAAVDFLALPMELQLRLWPHLSPALSDTLLATAPLEPLTDLLSKLDSVLLARRLRRLSSDRAQAVLGTLSTDLRAELQRLMDYPRGTAGYLMQVHPATLPAEMTVAQARRELRRQDRSLPLRSLFLLGSSGEVNGVVDIGDLALAAAEQNLESLAQPLRAAAQLMDTAEDIVGMLEGSGADELAVLDPQGRLAGVIVSKDLRTSVKDKALSDMQTMVGASEDERALSPVLKAAKTRVIWMHINLLTAFLAAAVVGMFEHTIASFTALAVLLPVVAGQSGNAGAQALAVTMRGLALREVSVRQWWLLLSKETRLGMLNGVAVAASTAVGVFLWSRSLGLSAIIAVSMVLSMTIACMAGAMVPVMLTRLRQDPASSASIILTTVTDIAGFFSFLGIATMLSSWLTPG